MAIFKFHSGNEKPSALKIWTTLIDTPIHPREGYTEDQIRYRMFILLQLHTNFKIATQICDGIIDSNNALLEPLLSASRILASCTESDFSGLVVLSEAFPHWVSSELYTPYYLTKMLCHKLNNFDLLLSLFDRTDLLNNETYHWNIDQMSVDYYGLTAYKLYNSMHMDEMLPYITISYDRTSTPVTDRVNIAGYIRDELLDALESADNFIIPEGSKITIPYFVLKTNTTVPPVPPMPQKPSSTKPFVVGDKVRLRSDLVPDKHYGEMKFHKEMRFDSITTIFEASSSGNFQIINNSFMYSPEMLEHVEGGTDASCQV